jgi:PAS domain S-box-containing protein
VTTAVAASVTERLPSVQDGGLTRRARWLLLGLTLPLVIVVLVLAAFQYREQRQQVLQDLATAGGAHAVALNTVGKLANDHVAQMRAWSEGYLTSPPSATSNLRQHFTPRLLNGRPDGYTLDAVPADKRPLIGQLLWFTGDPRQPETGRVLLDQALDFFGLIRLTHNVTPHFQWSYYFAATRDYVAIYPWAPSAEVVATGGDPSLLGSVSKWFDYEIFKAGTPELNPQRTPYWTQPYIDAFGAGAMVSLGTPVYVNDRFAGIVGTDLKLRTMEALVHSMPVEVGRLWVLDARDMVLSDSAESATDPIRRFADVRPAGIDDAALAAARATPRQVLAAANHSLVAYTLPDAPWTLVYGFSDAEITRLLLPRFVPYGVIVVILAFNFLLALYLLRRELIQPALALAAYLQRVSTDTAATGPRLPPLWQPAAEVVAAALAANREATRRLQESEAFKTAIVDNASLAIMTMDDRGRIVDFNPAAEAIFGHRREQALSREWIELLVPPAHQDKLRQELAGARTAGAGDRREIEAVHADGTPLQIELSVSTTRVAGALYFTAFAADLSTRKAAEREMETQREALRQSEKLSAMGALLAGVAHELNNPLAILMGRSALLERKALDPVVKSDALKIHAAADRCGRIVRTFLAMARQRPVQRRHVQLAYVAAGAIDLVGYNLRSSGIDVELHFDDGLPALQIDADQIGQVVVNLLVNAQHALSDQPEPRRVRLSGTRTATHLTLCVDDNGPGVPADIRERIFDPFFTTKVEGAGTGVGLSVSRAIVREHGGDLRLLDTASGACFEVELPLGNEPAPTLIAADETFARMLPAGTALVVDDEPEVAQVLCDILRSAGCTAVTLASGREALAWLDENSCSFILCDVRMPDMDGPALWRGLRDRHPHMLAHLAFITGDTLSASIAPFLRETGLPSLEKPFTPEEVLELVALIESP